MINTIIKKIRNRLFYQTKSVVSDTSIDHITTSLCGFESFHDNQHKPIIQWDKFKNTDNRDILIKEYDSKLVVPTRNDVGRALMYINISYDNHKVYCKSMYNDFANGYYNIMTDTDFEIDPSTIDVTDVELDSVQYCTTTKKFTYKNSTYTIEELISKVQKLHITTHINKYMLSNPSLRYIWQLNRELAKLIKLFSCYNIYNYFRKYDTFRHKDDISLHDKIEKKRKEIRATKIDNKTGEPTDNPTQRISTDKPIAPKSPNIKLFGLEVPVGIVILMIVLHCLFNIYIDFNGSFKNAYNVITMTEPSTALITMMILYTIVLYIALHYMLYEFKLLGYLFKWLIKLLYPTWVEYVSLYNIEYKEYRKHIA